ncbi:hypothetical protein Tco_1539765 [Tanacetum coccineum]
MDCAINDLASKFASMALFLKRSDPPIESGDGNLENRKSNNEEEECDDGYRVFARKPKRWFSGPRIMNMRIEGQHDYADRQRYRVKGEIPNFLENLDLEVVLELLY